MAEASGSRGLSLVALSVAVAACACWGGEAGMFDGPAQRGPLRLEQAGAKGWRVLAAAVSPVGGVAHPGEVVSLSLVLRNEGDAPLASAPVLEIVRIGTRFERFERDPEARGPAREVNSLVPLAEPVRVELPPVQVAGKAEAALAWKQDNADAFAEFGLYAVVLELPGKGRQAAATFARVRPPNPAAGNGKDSPLLLPLHPGIGLERQLDMAVRLGFRWVRTDDVPSWAGASQADPAAPFDWSKADAWMDAARKRGLHVLTHLCGSPRQTITDANWQAGNRVHDPKYDERFGDFVAEAAARYCGPEGDGPLQIIDFWKEPWEGGGALGWKSDAVRYRQLYRIVYGRAKKASPRITVGGTSRLTNTFDKLFSAKGGFQEWGKQLDVLTDHNVAPYACFGPRVGQKLIVSSIEVAAPLGASAETLVAAATHFAATGQRKVGLAEAAPLFWENGPAGPLCTPAAAAASFFLWFTAGLDFERIAAHDRLPWLYQWGSAQRVAFVLAGDRSRLTPGAVTPFDQIRANGSITVDAMGGRLNAYDLYGNPCVAKDGEYRLPCSFASAYAEAPGLRAEMAAQALAAGHVEGVTPVEFFADDFIVPIEKLKSFEFEVHNVLPQQVHGTVTVLPPSSIGLQETVVSVSLGAGATKTIGLPVNWTKAHPANAYPFTFRFETAAGKVEWTEELHVCIIPHGSPAVDGSITDWGDTPPVILRSPDVEFILAEAAWRPWETRKDVARGMAELRLMWDERHLYLAVRERNRGWRPKPRLSTRKDDEYFGAGDLAHTYVKDPSDALPFTGDCVQIGLRFLPFRTRLAAAGVVPPRMIAEDDTDYEYALWGTPDGGAEIWRSGAPSLGFFNFFPRCMPEGYDGVPKEAKVAVKHLGDDTIYEAAIPLGELEGLAPAPGKVLHVALALPGLGLELGTGRSRPRANALTLRPTWAPHLSADIRWGFVKD
ncbi:MAG TPA: hypothetical protein VNE39_05280 [Planctomycetota bacterium]|nr:hypothetical protein [Planctomycetota bacterium]